MEDKNFKTSDLGNLLDRPSPHHLRRITPQGFGTETYKMAAGLSCLDSGHHLPWLRLLPHLPSATVQRTPQHSQSRCQSPCDPLTPMHMCECVSDLTDCVLSLSRRACRPQHTCCGQGTNVLVLPSYLRQGLLLLATCTRLGDLRASRHAPVSASHLAAG